MAKRRLAHSAVVTAAALLLPLSGVPAASATDPAAGPTAFTGTVYLPDGETVAKAAVVDLSLAGARPFARGVSGVDGTFSVDVPETGELITLALAAGGRVSVRWTASDLYPASSVPQPQVSTQAVLGTVHTSPGFGQVAGEFVAYLIDTTTNALANALSDPKMVEFRLPDVAGMGPLITKVADLAAAHGIFNDPDMIAGNEDLDDPDVVPPLGAMLDVEAVTDAALYDPALPNLNDPPEAFDNGNGCTTMETWLLPARGTKPPNGTKYGVTLKLFKCNNEGDPYRDYWMWAWGGSITDVATATEDQVNIWRFKFRTQLQKTLGYSWDGVDPDEDRSAGGSWQLHWQVGFSDTVTGSLRGDYTVRKAKKIHQWYDYPNENAEKKLYHVSWLSNSDNGSHGDHFKDGGGMAFFVPDGEQQMRVRTSANTVHIWRCWYPKKYNYDDPPVPCDPGK